ncbi:MAG TPA: heme exporter protein CcmD [Devosiaceae bacterium]|jgi:heme exporter protein D|nr:heme exporter protein CcmD [Devosiaceae bacterium]
MLDLGPHAIFIIWAYVGVIVGVVALIAYTVFDSRRVNAHLKALDARGIRRRSERNS